MQKLDRLFQAYLTDTGAQRDRWRNILYDILFAYISEDYPSKSEKLTDSEAIDILALLGTPPPSITAFYLHDTNARERYLQLIERLGYKDESIDNFQTHIISWAKMGLHKVKLDSIPSKSKRTIEDSNLTRQYADDYLKAIPPSTEYVFAPTHYVSNEGVMFRGVMIEDIDKLTLVSRKPLFCIGDPWEARYYSYGFTLPEAERETRKPFMVVIMFERGTPMWESRDGEWQLPIKNAYLSIRKHIAATDKTDIDIVYADFFPMNADQMKARNDFIADLRRQPDFVRDHKGMNEEAIMDVAMAYFNDYVVSGDARGLFD